MKPYILGLIFGGLVIASLIMVGSSSDYKTTENTLNIPSPSGYVVDEESILRLETTLGLTELLEHTQENGGEVAVLVVKTTNGLDIADYGIKVADSWKVGHEGKDDGVILILATEDRQVRIEVGRGVEHLITDAEAGRILDTAMVPYLKDNKWDEAVIAGVQAVINRLNNGD